MLSLEFSQTSKGIGKALQPRAGVELESPQGLSLWKFEHKKEVGSIKVL